MCAPAQCAEILLFALDALYEKKFATMAGSLDPAVVSADYFQDNFSGLPESKAWGTVRSVTLRSLLLLAWKLRLHR